MVDFISTKAWGFPGRVRTRSTSTLPLVIRFARRPSRHLSSWKLWLCQIPRCLIVHWDARRGFKPALENVDENHSPTIVQLGDTPMHVKASIALALLPAMAACTQTASNATKATTRSSQTTESSGTDTSEQAAGESQQPGEGSNGSGSPTNPRGSGSENPTLAPHIAVVGTLAFQPEGSAIDTAMAFPLGSNAMQQVTKAIAAPIAAGTIALEIPQDSGGGQSAGLALNDSNNQGCGGGGGSGIGLQDAGNNAGNNSECSTASGDWVVALIDSTKASKLEQIVGFLGLSAGADSMIKLPIANATGEKLDFGQVAVGDGNATSSTSLTDEGKKFELQLAMLNEIASTDDVTKGLKNLYANTSADGKTYYQIEPFFLYRNVLVDSPAFNYDAAKNVYLAPDGVNFAPAAVPTGQDCAPSAGLEEPGYGFYFKAHDPAHATFDDICSGVKNLALTAPGVLCKRNLGGVAPDYLTSFGHAVYSHPAVNTSNPDCVPPGSQTDFYMRGAWGDSNLGFNFGGGGYSGAILPGVWTLKVDGTQVAEFDVSSYSPVDLSTRKPLVYVPATKVSVGGDGKITKVEVKWYFWNRDKRDGQGASTPGYDEVTDLTVFKRAVSKLSVYLGDNSGSTAGCVGNAVEEYDNLQPTSGNTYEVTNFQHGPWGFFGDSSQAGLTATGMTVRYDIAGMSINFEYKAKHDGCN